jgi:hypothetical protein
VPNARSIITIAIVAGLTFLAIEHVKERGGLAGVTTKSGGNRLRGVS